MISNITYGTYFVYAACTTISVPFIWFMIPETKGLKLEDVDDLFRDGRFLHYRKTTTRRDEATVEKAVIEHIERVEK